MPVRSPLQRASCGLCSQLQRAAADRRHHAVHLEIARVVRPARAGTQFEIVGELVVGRTEHRPRLGALGLRGVAVQRVVVEGGVVEVADRDVFVEVVGADLPVELVLPVAGEAELLGDLAIVRQRVGGLGRERDEARTHRRVEARAVTAVDVAEAVGGGAFQPGDRREGGVAHVPAQMQVAAPAEQVLPVAAVLRNLVAVEAGHEAGVAQFDRIGAIDHRAAVQPARMAVDQGTETAVLVQRLQPHGAIVVAAQHVLLTGEGVVDPAVAMLRQRGDAAGPVPAQRATQRRLGVRGAQRAVRDAGVAAGLLARAHRLELDHAGRRVAPEQRALRAAQHLDLGQVEQREALQDRVLLHDVVVHHRHRLRGVEVEVAVAQAADVEARKLAAVRGLGVDAGRARCQLQHAIAGLAERLQLVRRQYGQRHRHLLHVLHPFRGGDVHRLQLGGLGALLDRCGGFLRQRGRHRQGKGQRDRQGKHGGT